MPEPAAPLDPLRADPSTAAVLCDFDGTLSAIVDDPAAARPVEGAVEALAAAADRFAVVAVVSGRPAGFLRAVVPAGVEIAGLYGLERVRGGEVVDHPDAEPWRAVVERAAADAAAVLPGEALVEPKGLSLTVHYRTAPEVADAVRDWAAARAAADGLQLRPAKMSVELHPPVSVDKGTTVRDLAAGMRAACFLGDDVGDIPAFTALAALRTEGMATVNVAVRTTETPPEVLALADVTVDGPAGAVELLASLAEPAG